MSALALTACNGSATDDSAAKAGDSPNTASSSATASITPTPAPTPEGEDDVLPADELEAFVTAFNTRNSKALCSRAPGDDAVAVGEDGKADWSNLYLATPGDEIWQVCIDMYSTGWSTCPDYKIAAAGAEDGGLGPYGSFDLSWGSDAPYRGIGLLLQKFDEKPELGWVWGAQNFECEG